MMNAMNEDNLARDLRKEFFAYRNGIVADRLRKAGDPHTIIMGCLLADIMDITARTREAVNDDSRLQSLAQELWDDTNSRECRLAAPMLYPPHMMSLAAAQDWCQTVETTEVADNLCHKMLRHHSDAAALFRQLIAQERPLVKYTGYRLLLNLLLSGKVQATPSLKSIIETEASQAHAPLTALLRDLLEEF